MVDAAYVEMLRRAGHEVWTASDAGRARTTDDDQTVYAMDRHAVLVTHDIEFTRRRKVEPHGHHVRLVCREWDAVDLLAGILPELVDVLRASAHMTVEVRTGKAKRPRG
jgi:predicted nuclease of predicted toxin-antitoxin system